MTERLHYRACNLCEAICGLEIVANDDAIESLRGDRDDPLSRGHLCPKAFALEDVHRDPDRLRHPLRRTAGGWRRIGWKAALDETASRLQQIQDQHGRDAVALYLGNPNVHNYGSILFGPSFRRTLRTTNRYSASSLDQWPHQLVSWLMFGHQALFPVPDIDRTDFFVIMGGNPLVSNGSLMTAPDIATRLRAIRARGGKVFVIDPRRTETAKVADQHLFIRPGTDAMLLSAVLNVLFADGLTRPGRLADFTDGIDVLRERVAPFTPERVAGATGIEAIAIRALASDFAMAGPAVWYGRLGVCAQEFGSLAMWLIYALNVVTGNLDRVGGAMFTRPAVDPLGTVAMSPGSFGRWRSRVRGLPEVCGELPAAAMAEEMLTPGPGQVRALVTAAGNPVLSAPDGRRLEEAISRLDFMVSIDIYLNETTRHAHLILPPTTALEHENYDVVFHLLAIRNTARYSPALFRPAPDARHDWEILLDLDTRLRSRSLFGGIKARVRRSLLRSLGPEGMIDFGLRFGPYGAGWRFWRKGLTLARLKMAPHGVDLGPLAPCLPGRLCTPNKRIALAPKLLLDDFDRLEAKLLRLARNPPQPSAESNPSPHSGRSPHRRDELRERPEWGEGFPTLLLIGRRHLLSNNSWMHNSERLMRGKPRCVLLIHPADSAARGIADGGRVRIVSSVGNIEAEAALTEDLMPGVVSLPHGWGHHREGVQLRTAQGRPGVSVNDITDPLALDGLSGNAVLNGVPVEVVAVSEG